MHRGKKIPGNTAQSAALFGNEKSMLDLFLKAADKFDKEHGQSRKAALKQLRREGIVTKSGKLTRNYGG